MSTACDGRHPVEAWSLKAGAFVQEVFSGQAEVVFTTTRETEFGSEVRVVGSEPQLGSWNPSSGISLTTSSDCYPQWSTTVWLPADAAGWEYKFVVVKSDESVEWEHGNNRILDPPLSLGASVPSSSSSCAPQLFNTCKLCTSVCRCTLVKDRLCCGMTILFEVVHHGTAPGDQLFVTGDADSLGSWDPSKGLRLFTCQNTFPVWRGSSRLLLNDLNSAWKIVCRRANGRHEWERREDRRVSVQHIKGHDVESWLISATFGGAHKEPVPYGTRDLPRLLGSNPLWRSIGCRDSYVDVPQRHRRVDSSASTCLADDESADWAEDIELSEASKISPTSSAYHSLQFWSGAQQVEKAGGRCEDAYFNGDHALGVADGVGSMAQFAKHGADSAAYAAELMQLAATATLPGANSANLEVSVVERAVTALSYAEQGAKAYGASTALVLALEGETIGVASLGDSGFMQLRRTRAGMAIIERTTGQQHSWNCPYQLSRLPPAIASRVPKNFKPDSASDCERMEVPACAGDLLLLFTDGLIDNLHEHEILEIVNRLAGTALEPGCPQVLAKELAFAAHERSLDPKAEVPFTWASRQQGQEVLGGKPDDITVVAAWIV